MARTENKKGVSPRGVFVFPHLNTPDTKYKTEGEFHVKVRCDAEDPKAKALIKAIDAAAAESLAKAKEEAKTPALAKKWETLNIPYAMEEDDDGDETGNVLFTFKATASGTVKKTGKPWSRKIKLFDAKLNPITAAIWGGSEGKVSFEFVPYAKTPKTGASVSLRIVGVQVLKLVSGGDGGNAGDMGFEEEDGFEGTNEEGFSEEEGYEGNDTDDDADDDPDF